MVKPYKINVQDLKVSFGAIQALKGINLGVHSNEILSIIGPANSGKSTYLRCLNRFNDSHAQFAMQGKVTINDIDWGGSVPEWATMTMRGNCRGG